MVSNREKRYDDLRIIYSVSQNGFWLQSSTSYTLVLTLKVVIQMNYNFGATKLALLVAIHFFWIVVCFLVLNLSIYVQFATVCTCSFCAVWLRQSVQMYSE